MTDGLQSAEVHTVRLRTELPERAATATMADSDQNETQGESAPPGDAPPVKQPGRIGRYRIERILGKGGFGLVYLAHDEQLDRLVAVKVPHAKLVSKSEDAEAYLAEARTVASLDHPNIVPVFDVGSTDDCPCYVVSKYVEGTDLAKNPATWARGVP